MATLAHRGRNKLVKRLAAQTGNEGMARALLKKRGHMKADGSLTPEGERRNKMTAAERAKDRAAKVSGKPTQVYKYNPRSNTATLKGKK